MDEDIFVTLRFLKHHDTWEYCSLPQPIAEVKSHFLCDSSSQINNFRQENNNKRLVATAGGQI